jgi:hypothetical protein
MLLEDYKVRQCKQLAGEKVCPDLSQLSTGLDNSCLGSLFLRDGEGVNLHCEQQIKGLREEIIDLENGHYYILSAAELKTQMVCPTTDEREYKIPALTQSQLYIAPGCTFKTKTATLRGYEGNSNQKAVVTLFQSLELDNSDLKAFKEVDEEEKTKLSPTEIDGNSMLNDSYVPLMVSGCIIIVGAVAFLVFFFIKCERID